MFGAVIVGLPAFIAGEAKSRKANHADQLDSLILDLTALRELAVGYYTGPVSSDTWEKDGINMQSRMKVLGQGVDRFEPVFGSKYFDVCFVDPMTEVNGAVTGGDFQSRTRNRPDQAREVSSAISVVIGNASTRKSELYSLNPFRRYGWDHPSNNQNLN